MRTIKQTFPAQRHDPRAVGTIVPALLLTMTLVTPTAFAQSAGMPQYLQRSDHAGKQTEEGQITFSGQKITIPVVAVEPGKPDTTFEIHNQVDPTLVVPANTPIRMTLANMDAGMAHGLDIIRQPPPYKKTPGLPMAQSNNSNSSSVIAMTGEAAPHEADEATLAVKSTRWFQLKPGKYYYVCPVPGHAHKGMHGKIIAR